MPHRPSLRALTNEPWFRLWLAVLALAVVLTLLVELEAIPDEAGLVRDVQASGFPGSSASDAVRTVTSTRFVIIVGVTTAALHLLMRDRRAAVILLTLLVLLPATQGGLKELVDRPRPAESGIEARADYTSPSFPAGHVMGPTVVYGWALAMLLWGRAPGRKARSRGVQPADGPYRGLNPAASYAGRPWWLMVGRWTLVMALAAVLALTGIANVYLGVHWPADVLGGYLWGLVLLLPALALRSGSPLLKKERGRG